MKLLIITQRVDLEDSNLGFFHRWLERFAERLEKVYVVCLSEGKHRLPNNVQVFSLGKGFGPGFAWVPKGFSKLRRLFRLEKFLLKHLSQVDGIFCHMCSIHALVSFPLVKFFRKKLILWYAHGHTDFILKLTEKCVDKIVTSSKKAVG